MATLIVLGVVARRRAVHAVARRSGSCRRRGPGSSSGSAATTARSTRASRSSCPFVDRLKPLIDLRETVVSFPPQPVITEDNLVVNIDTVIYFQVTDPKAATYEIADYIGGDRAAHGHHAAQRDRRDDARGHAHLARPDQRRAADVLDEATGKWGIRVNRVELKAVDPPASIQEAMEKQMRAERDKRAAILHRRGRQAVADPHRRGREAERDPEGGGPARVADPRGRGPVEGDRDGVRRRSTAATPTRSCSPTSTCRCCRRSPRASRTRSGSSRARSRRRWASSSAALPTAGSTIHPHSDGLRAHGPDDR